MFILENYFGIEGKGVIDSLFFISENIDLITRSLEKADMIFESYFTECWIEGGFDE
jgi:hypothetical protein